MSNCITINVLEKTALNKLKGLPLAQKTTAHLESCQLCREQFENLIQQFQLYEEQFEKFPEHILEQISNSITHKQPSAYIFEASLLKDTTELHGFDESFNTRAADSNPRPAVARFQSVAVLSTPESDLLVRITHDADQGNTWLHLIAENDEKVRHVPIRIEPTAQDYITDDLGRVNLGNQPLPVAEQLKVIVQTPRASFDMTILEQSWSELVGKGEIIVTNQANDQMFIEFQPQGETYRLSVRLHASQISGGLQKIQIVANKENGLNKIKAVKRGVAIFSEVTETALLRIKIFG
ncbi:MAG: hypothetical protein L3J79_07895 [Candidatus Marinimicrobia bacterium]|nr:hypothetical protein [Candidatus Neomarinimicrobiota bacterium]